MCFARNFSVHVCSVDPPQKIQFLPLSKFTLSILPLCRICIFLTLESLVICPRRTFSRYLMQVCCYNSSVCVFQLDPAAYMDTCLYLFCSLPPKDRDGAVCDTLASYARECAQQHVIIMWRTDTLCGNEI